MRSSSSVFLDGPRDAERDAELDPILEISMTHPRSGSAKTPHLPKQHSFHGADYNANMDLRQVSIRQLQLAMTASPAGNPASGVVEAVASQALSAANGNESHNTYLWRNEAWTMAEARRAAEANASRQKLRFGELHSHPLLWAIPISVKDCFDLAGAPTSCGTRFYRDWNGIAAQDSWLVEKLRQNGAVITGKTHLHPLAYGITGENAEFGDCLQPGNPGALTGGSSSGAAASILEGSAMIAIGTDTGGSIRVPAALCGLAGYRATLGRGDWRGAAHLAESFDTMGGLYRDLEDSPILGALLQPASPAQSSSTTSESLLDLLRLPRRMAIVDDEFLHDCEPAAIEGFRTIVAELESLGLSASTVKTDWWSDSLEIFAAIQAWEAARIHRGHFEVFEPGIRQRLEWGASIGDDAIATLRNRHAEFRARMDAWLAEHEFLVLPAAPVTRLQAGADHSQTRTRLLRYTTPVSLAGMPAVTIPCTGALTGAGVQLVAAREKDDQLLRFAARIGAARKKRS